MSVDMHAIVNWLFAFVGAVTILLNGLVLRSLRRKIQRMRLIVARVQGDNFNHLYGSVDLVPCGFAQPSWTFGEKAGDSELFGF